MATSTLASKQVSCPECLSCLLRCENGPFSFALLHFGTDIGWGMHTRTNTFKKYVHLWCMQEMCGLCNAGPFAPNYMVEHKKTYQHRLKEEMDGKSSEEADSIKRRRSTPIIMVTE